MYIDTAIDESLMWHQITKLRKVWLEIWTESIIRSLDSLSFGVCRVFFVTTGKVAFDQKQNKKLWNK